MIAIGRNQPQCTGRIQNNEQLNFDRNFPMIKKRTNSQSNQIIDGKQENLIFTKIQLKELFKWQRNNKSKMTKITNYYFYNRLIYHLLMMF